MKPNSLSLEEARRVFRLTCPKWRPAFACSGRATMRSSFTAARLVSAILSLRTWVRTSHCAFLFLAKPRRENQVLSMRCLAKCAPATDVLPCTDAITQYIFARPGLPNAIVFDTIGFAGKGDKAAIEKLDEELGQCDLVIAVCSANLAARDPDRQLLDEARLRFSANLKRAAPPIVVALSHVDKVRPFNEWNPPYNFMDGQSPKERNVRDAIGEVAKDLQIHRDLIMPVYLRQNRVYNVEEGLLPLIAAHSAGRRTGQAVTHLDGIANRRTARSPETATCQCRLQCTPIGCLPRKTKGDVFTSE